MLASSLGELPGCFDRRWTVADLLGDGQRQLAVGNARELLIIDGSAEILDRTPLPDAKVWAANDLNGNGRQELIVSQDDRLLVFDGGLPCVTPWWTHNNLICHGIPAWTCGRTSTRQ